MRALVVPVDLSSRSKIGLDAARCAAELMGASHLHLVYVVPYSQFALDMPGYSGVIAQGTIDAVVGAAEASLAELTCPNPNLEITREVRFGAPAREIVQVAEDRKAELIVLATSERSKLGRLVVGSVAHTVLRAAPCPVLIVGEDRPFRSLRKILVGIDLSPVSTRVLEQAIAFARSAGADVTVVSAFDLLWVPPTSMESAPLPLDAADRAALRDKHRAAVDALIERMRDPAIQVSSAVVASAPPSKAITDHTEKIEADLIVVGASGHSAWRRLFLGSTATRVLSSAHCPVIVVPEA